MKVDLKDLRKPFLENEIEWRIQQAGEKNGKTWAMVLAYVQSRAVMDRLDDVFGPDGWQSEIVYTQDGMFCKLSCFVNSMWVTKMDGAPQTNIESFKGGISDALKRAAVQWGIGRYLYNLDVSFAKISENGKYSGKTKDGNWFKWDAPKLPSWALPEDNNIVKTAEKVGTAVEEPLDDGLDSKYTELANELHSVINGSSKLITDRVMAEKAWTHNVKWINELPKEYRDKIVGLFKRVNDKINK